MTNHFLLLSLQKLTPMTPKEKALELVDKYTKLEVSVDILDEYDGWSDTHEEEIYMKFKNTKQCAIIAVNEILNIDWLIPEPGNVNLTYDYWQQVKIEIEKL